MTTHYHSTLSQHTITAHYHSTLSQYIITVHYHSLSHDDNGAFLATITFTAIVYQFPFFDNVYPCNVLIVIIVFIVIIVLIVIMVFIVIKVFIVTKVIVCY